MSRCNRPAPAGAEPAAAQDFRTAETLHRQGRLREAEALYRAILKLHKRDFDCLHNLGLICAQEGRFEDAIAQLRAAIRQNPRSAEAHNNLGNVLAALRRHEAAVASYRSAIALKPEFVEAHNNLGNALAFAGNMDEAVVHYARALALRPDYAAAHVNLGNVLKELGRLDEAIARYEEALTINPRIAEAHYNISGVLRRLGRLSEAVTRCERALALRPGYAEAHNALGNLLREQGRGDEAAACYRRAITLKPDYAEAHCNLAALLCERREFAAAVAAFEQALTLAPHLAEAWLGRGDALQRLQQPHEAIAAYRQALAVGSDAEVVRFALAALGAEAAPSAAPRQFVAKVFDRYAGHYDRHVIGTLKYRTADLLAKAVTRFLPRRKLDILDLGCGTGLLGIALAPRARTLTGVDLSANMLKRAEERQVYDHLICGELTEFLQTQAETFDLVAAADVLVYIGDLSEVFRGAARALNGGGLFGFSVEVNEPQDFALRSTRRYGHARAYLRTLAHEHRFAVEAIEAKVIRQEDGNDVEGYIAVLRRP
jgi:predicted TPR repeat methyltransferase